LFRDFHFNPLRGQGGNFLSGCPVNKDIMPLAVMIKKHSIFLKGFYEIIAVHRATSENPPKRRMA
jgi:hypothetical protein